MAVSTSECHSNTTPSGVEQRSAFFQLKDGAKIPGYKGFCPEYQFTFGKTFAEATSRQSDLEECKFKGRRKDLDVRGLEVPGNNGFNRYTTGMVTGYTGYIPKRSNQFGKTYATECMDCFKDHFNELKQYKMDTQVALSSGRLKPLRSEDDISEHMKVFASNRLTGRDQNKVGGTVEGPISGYTGHIPKKDRTELGLGTCFDQAAMKGLECFNLETNRYRNKMNFYGKDRTCCCRHFQMRTRDL